MAKIGNYNIPEITLNKCINVCNIINSSKDRSMSRLELSMLINMSARGGQYSKLINSCKSWGLIDGREFYSVTQLGIKVLNPANSNELILSKKELILSNSFFYQLYSKYPNIEHSETSLLQSIEEITGSDRSLSIKYENLLRKILFEINPIVKSSLDSNSSSNRLIWLSILLSKLFFDFKIIFGIELNSDCLLLFISSKAPALTSPSS